MSDFTNEVLRSQTGAAFFYIVDIYHEDVGHIYFCNNNESITYDAIEYLPFPFKLTPANDKAGEEQAAQITCDNINREISERIIQIDSPATFRQAIIMIKPDGTQVLEQDFSEAELRDVTWDAFTLSGSLYSKLNMKYYAGVYSYNNIIFPGLYA